MQYIATAERIPQKHLNKDGIATSHDHLNHYKLYEKLDKNGQKGIKIFSDG